MQQEPLVVCTYGWGRVFKLYHKSLEVHGTSYEISDLMYIRSIHRCLLGIPSVRLVLRFREHDVLLRGIAALEDAAKIVDYLTIQCAIPGRIEQGKQSSTRNASSVRTEERPLTQRATDVLPIVPKLMKPMTLPDAPPISQDAPVPLSAADQLSLDAYAQAPTRPVAVPEWRKSLQEQTATLARHQQPTRKERALHPADFDEMQLSQHLQKTTLPALSVPIRLFPGEYAHYNTDATLCAEPVSEAAHNLYPARDHGTLILTNKRMIYIGRKSQMVLGYAHLLHVSRLPGAIAFLAEGWAKREIFEVSRPLECTMYIDSILRRFQQQPETGKVAVITHPREANIRQASTVNRVNVDGGARARGEGRLRRAMAADIDTLPLSAARWNMVQPVAKEEYLEKSQERS